MASNLVGCIYQRFGGGDHYHLTPPEDFYMRVPDQVRKSVLFVGIEQDLPEWEWKGTAYLVTVPPSVFQETTEHRHYSGDEGQQILLATARHVAEKCEGKDFALRVNVKDGSLRLIKGHANQKWWYHPTEKKYVDAAVTIFSPSGLADLDISPIPFNMFVDTDAIARLNLGVGDEVFLAGLFTEVTETTRNIPIVRLGSLAMMPGEKIPFKDGKLIDAYLVEARSIGGLSGSPVFVRQTVAVQGTRPGIWINSPQHVPPPDLSVVVNGVGRIYFLGSMIGHWDAPTGLQLPEAVNMGVSPIVPAHKIGEIIRQAELRETMKNIANDASRQKHSNAKEDFATSRPKEQPFTKADFEAALKKVSRKKSDQT